MPSVETIKWSDEKEFKEFLQALDREGHLNRHFLIEVFPKKGHPWAPHITQTSNCFAVNNIKGRTLTLTRGHRYYFTFAPDYAYPVPPLATPLVQECKEKEPGLIKDIIAANKSRPRVEEACTGEYCVFFTSDPTGGAQGGKFPGDFDPINYQPEPLPGTPPPFGEFTTVSFVVDETFPHLFYYQSTMYQFMGGIILVTGSCRKPKPCCPSTTSYSSSDSSTSCSSESCSSSGSSCSSTSTSCRPVDTSSTFGKKYLPFHPCADKSSGKKPCRQSSCLKTCTDSSDSFIFKNERKRR